MNTLRRKIISRLIQKTKCTLSKAEDQDVPVAERLINQIETWATESRRRNGTTSAINADDIKAQLSYFSRMATESAKIEEATVLLDILQNTPF